MFKIGQSCVVKPVTFRDEKSEKFDRGTILYIHPKFRYILVGVQTQGGMLRECFSPEKVRIPDKKRKR